MHRSDLLNYGSLVIVGAGNHSSVVLEVTKLMNQFSNMLIMIEKQDSTLDSNVVAFDKHHSYLLNHVFCRNR